MPPTATGVAMLWFPPEVFCIAEVLVGTQCQLPRFQLLFLAAQGASYTPPHVPLSSLHRGRRMQCGLIECST